MKKQLKRLLSLLLVLCLMLSAAPVMALSVEEEKNVATQNQTSISVAEDVSVVREETSLRGEYEKHFLMSDGTYQAVVYSYPVHKLVNGTWIEIEGTNQNARGDVPTDSTQQNIIDNYVLEDAGIQNSNLDRLYIGKKSGKTARAYIQFAVMPTLPDGATISSATMTLNIVSGTSTANAARAYQVTGGEWTSSALQWSNKPDADILLAQNISHNNKTKYQFSCLEAVRHWYDEDSAGQNENYGIVLCYHDESINDYNAIYSADCADVSKRPSLTISYDPQKISIKEGQSCDLSASNLTGSVTWSSSNTAVAAVSSTGVVTGIKAGCATITARANGTVVKEYTVYVKFFGGVYYIRNKSTQYYLSAKNKGISPGTRLIQSEKMEHTWDGLWQIWRITYISDGYYTIRPMHKPDMGLAYTDALELQNIGITYSMAEIGEAALWTISYSNGGYEISNCGRSNYSICSVDSQCDTNVTITSTSSAPIFRWLFESASVETDLLLYTIDTEQQISQPRRGAAPGQTRTLEDINLTLAVSSIKTVNQTVNWKSFNESVATVDYVTGEVTGVSAGEAIIQGTAWVNGVPHCETYTLVVSEIPISGSELPYEPSIWNSEPVKSNTNCYSYAFNNQEFEMNPGMHSIGLIPQSYISKITILQCVVADAEQLGFGFSSIYSDECCPTGSYKVALVIAPGQDYHWYRQNPDGTWSHKLGNGEMLNTDSSGNIIYDPYDADKYYVTENGIVHYTVFVGYYCVTPLSDYSTAQSGESIFVEESDNQAFDCSYELEECVQ